MILCFQCEDLSKIFLVSKFEMNMPNIKLIITFSAIWHYRDLKGLYGCIAKTDGEIMQGPGAMERNRVRAFYHPGTQNNSWTSNCPQKHKEQPGAWLKVKKYHATENCRALQKINAPLVQSYYQAKSRLFFRAHQRKECRVE